MKNTLKKSERLKSNKQISLLFKKRQSIGAYPLRLFWLPAAEHCTETLQMAFSAPKRKFKKAVDRNRCKRLMREVHRLHKQRLITLLQQREERMSMLLLLVDKEIPDFKLLEKKYLYLIEKLAKELENGST